MNRLLEGDYDSQGYVTHPGHIFNYFVKDGIYYFCDFVQFFHRSDPPNGIPYLLYVTDDPMDFGSYYVNRAPIYNDSTAPEYIIHLSCYALDGRDKVANGWPCDPSKYQLSPMGDNIWYIFDKDVEDDLTLLFIRDGYRIEFAEAPPLSVRPPEINIPTDAEAGIDY